MSISLPPSEAIDLVASIAYQDDGIASRALARAKGGSLTLFAFDAGQELSEHSSPFDAIVQVLEGEADVIIAGKSVMASAGHWVLMPADIPHGIKAPGRFKMLLTMLRDPAE